MPAKNVQPADPVRKTSPITEPTGDEATVQMTDENESCFWNDEKFKHGEMISAGGQAYVCNFGNWMKM
ncbi:MAG: hypothetical protein HYR49_06565 [Gammaproteobacteria bacterium]|nr:hypothetical protein [Gammaproteobacteria bacterium]